MGKSILEPIDGQAYDLWLDKELDAYYGDRDDDSEDALGMGPDEE